MNKLILTTLFSSLCLFVNAQSWQKTYGGKLDDYGSAIQQTADSGFIITGNTESFGAGSTDMYLIRIDKNGDTLWTKTYGGTNADAGETVIQTPDKGFIVGGQTTGSGGGTFIYLVKTNMNGDTLWTKIYGNNPLSNYCTSIVNANGGGYCLTGSTGYSGTGKSDVYLVRIDNRGDTVWTKRYGGPQDDFGYTLQQTKDGGYIIAGAISNAVTFKYHAYLVKTDSAGDTLWTKTFADENAYGSAIIQTSNNEYVMAGYILGTGYYIIKTTRLGDTLFTRKFTIGTDDRCFSAIESDGGYVMAGYTLTGGNANVLLLKVDTSGNQLWAKEFGGTNWDDCNSIQAVAGGGFIMAGSTQSSGAGGSDVYVIKSSCINFPDVNINTNDVPSFCQGDTVSVSMYSLVTGGSFYQWTRDSVNIPGATSNAYTTDSAGTYMLLVTDSNGCSNFSGSITVFISQPPPKPTITQSGNTLIVPDGFEQFQWYINDTLISGATDYDYTITRPGKYKVEVSYGSCGIFADEFIAYLLGTELINGGVLLVTVSPNPFSASAVLTISNQPALPVSNLQFLLRDVLGRTVWQTEIKNLQSEIPRGNLPAGIYFYQLKNENKILVEGKVVAQ